MGGESASLPIQRVQLLKNGIAYMEREGKVVDNTVIDLYFKSSEMNDVLKSLTALDLNGGIISSISYAANQSASGMSHSIQFNYEQC